MSAWRQGSWRTNAWRVGSWRGLISEINSGIKRINRIVQMPRMYLVFPRFSRKK